MFDAAGGETPPTEAPVTAPRLRRGDGAAQLIVDGKPFFVRGAELHNSSSTSLESLRHGLTVAAAANANTVLAAVAWEDVEPTEGSFDFSVVDQLLEESRRAGLRVILLWFGAWKNGTSNYAPGWVRGDWRRFARCVTAQDEVTSTLSPFGGTDLDLAAFRSLVAHVEAADAGRRTVVMIQIENELGLLGSSRDLSDGALEAFRHDVPAAVLDGLRSRLDLEGTGAAPTTWDTLPLPQPDVDELFMASGYAAHVERLARAGRAQSAVPFFVNAWLDSVIDIDIPGFDLVGGQVPGTYPSGGPLPRVHEVWRALAPSVDLFCPDLYFGDAETIFTDFSTFAGGLFIPEMRRDVVGVGQIFLAAGRFHAIGSSPFGIDSAAVADLAHLTDAYRLLAVAADRMLDEEGRRRLTLGFHVHDAAPSYSVEVDDLRLTVHRAASFGVDPAGIHGYGLICRVTARTFLVFGRGFRLEFASADDATQCELASVTELIPEQGLAARRRLNGDETGSGRMIIHPSIGEPLPSPFPIPMHSEHTGASRCTVFTHPRFRPEP